MKKVLLVVTKSNWGGAQRYVFDLATHLPKNEFEVAVVLGGDGPLAEKLRAEKTTIYRSLSLGRDIAFGKDIQSFFELYLLFKKERPDVVHLNSSKAGALGALAARLAGVPTIIFTAHGWPFAERRSLVWRAFAWVGSWATALFAHRVICVSDAELRLGRYLPFVRHKMVRIYNGIDLNMSFGSGENIRRAFPPGVRIVGTVGELNHNKNQIALIEEARRNPNMYVAIVGEGELRHYLEKKIQEYGLEKRVKLFGFMPAAEVLKGFDVFALPSIKEGLAYVILEARVAGLPIEASRIGGIGEAMDRPLSHFSLERMVEETQKLYLS